MAVRAADEEGDVVVVVRMAQRTQEVVAGGFECRLRLGEEVEEGVQTGVDGLVAGFDEAVGVEEQLVPGIELQGGLLERGEADAEGVPVGSSTSSGGPPSRVRTGGMWPARAITQCMRCGS